MRFATPIRRPGLLRSLLLHALLGGACLCPAPLLAQGAEALAPGLRVRVQAPGLDPRWLVGSVVRDTADTLYLRTRQAVQPIPWEDIRAAEWSRGRRRAAGAARGAAIGSLVGGTLVAGILASMYQANAHTSQGQAAAYGLLIGGSIGFWPGLVLGSIWAPDRWTPVRWPR